MKMVVVVALALVACVTAAPSGSVEKDARAQILRFENKQNPEGSYEFIFENDNGIKRDEKGELKTVLDEENKPHNVVVVRGSYTFLDEQNQPQVINFYADESGYHAEGNAVPKAPTRR